MILRLNDFKIERLNKLKNPNSNVLNGVWIFFYNSATLKIIIIVNSTTNYNQKKDQFAKKGLFKLIFKSGVH